MKIHLVIFILLILGREGLAQSQHDPSDKKLTPLTLTVENQNTEGKDWSVAFGDNLSEPELAKLRALLEERLAVSHTLVPDSYKASHLFLGVVATKFHTAAKETFFVVSSAESVGLIDEHIDILTHNVIIERDLQHVAAHVVFYVAALDLQVGLGMLDKR
jgi:hypothetical protein